VNWCFAISREKQRDLAVVITTHLYFRRVVFDPSVRIWRYDVRHTRRSTNSGPGRFNALLGRWRQTSYHTTESERRIHCHVEGWNSVRADGPKCCRLYKCESAWLWVFLDSPARCSPRGEQNGIAGLLLVESYRTYCNCCTIYWASLRWHYAVTIIILIQLLSHEFAWWFHYSQTSTIWC